MNLFAAEPSLYAEPREVSNLEDCWFYHTVDIPGVGTMTFLRTALNAVYTKLGRALPAYTDPTIVPGQTVSKAAHVQELRTAVSALP